MNNVFPLDNFNNQLKKIKPVEKKFISTNFDQLSENIFKNSIPNFPNMGEHDLAVLIKNNIDIISKDILKGDQIYAPLLTDQKFIAAFIRAVSSIPIQYTTKLACNKITYDYFTSENPDRNIKHQYLNMSRVINREVINKLITIGLDENTACNLALARFSSANEKTNVKRLNFAMYYRDPNIMNEQMIVWIYEKLFNRISDLFLATMFETYSRTQQEDFGDNFMEVYGTVGLAVLIILNNMKSDDIRKVLIGYHEEWKFKGYPSVRFSLRALSEDFSRISQMVEYLNNNGITVP